MTSTDIKVIDAKCTVEPLTFRAPLKFGGRVVEHYHVVNVRLTVQTAAGRRAVGFGSMPVGHIWAWPTDQLDPAQTEEAMRLLSQRVAQVTLALDPDDPIAMGVQLAERLERLAGDVMSDLTLAGTMPRLAALVSASPVDAALHDAFGKVHQQNSFDVLGRDFIHRDLATYLNADFAGEFLDQYTLRQPKPRMPIYHLVGALDALTADDVVRPIGDGLPETLGDWIGFNGLTHLKIKLAGDQFEWDLDRIVAIERVAVNAQATRGCSRWNYSLDFNERCKTIDYVIDLLGRLQERSPQAVDRIQYIEQPTHRDLKRHGISVTKAAQIKPVVIDESLVDFESLLAARDLGYTGVALKACKGQTESLLMAAAAQKYGMFLCVQDLTCPGASFLHSAGLAARVPGIAAIEGNGRQYCPAGNVGWADRFPGMFRITDGTLETALLVGTGIGHA